MLKSLSYRRLLPDAFDLSSLAQALEEVVIPQIGRLAVAAFKAFDLSSLSKALDEDIAAHATRLSVAVSDAFDLSPLSLALEDVIATGVARPPVKAVTDVFDLSSLSRALDECVPVFAQLPVKVKHEFPIMNYRLHMTRTALPTTEFVNNVHGNITAAVTSTISAHMAEKSRIVDAPTKTVHAKPVPTSKAAQSAAPNTSVIVKHELPNMNYHLHMTRNASAITEFVNTFHDNITIPTVTSLTISARKAEKSRVVDPPAEVVDAKPVPTCEAAKSAAPVMPPRIDMINLASSSKVVMEDLKWRTGNNRCSSTFSKPSKRTQAPTAVDQSNISHTPSRNAKNKSIPSKKPSTDKPFHVITDPLASSNKVMTSSDSLIFHEPATLIVSKKRKYDVMVGTSDTLVPNKKCKYSHVITLPSRKRKLSDAFESFETGRPATKHKIDHVPESPVVAEIVPTLPPVNERSEFKLISEPAQSKTLPPVNQRSKSEQISEPTLTKALPPVDQHNESKQAKQAKQIPQLSQTKCLPTKKRSYDDAFESPEVTVTKDPRKRRREVDARPSITATPTTTSTQARGSDVPPVDSLPQHIVIMSRDNEQPTSREPKCESEPSHACRNEGDGLLSYEEFEALADGATCHELEDDRQTIITSLPVVGERTHHAADVFAEGHAENIVSVDQFIAECCAAVIEQRQREDLATNIETEDSAECDDGQTQEGVAEEGSVDEEEAEADEAEDEEEEEARQARYLQLCREVFGDGEDSDEDY